MSGISEYKFQRHFYLYFNSGKKAASYFSCQRAASAEANPPNSNILKTVLYLFASL